MVNDRCQFKKITTGNGYQNDLIATTNDRLEMTVIALQNLNKALTNELILARDAIDRLEDTIKASNDRNDRLQKWFLILAIIGTLLTATQLIQVWDIFAKGIGR